MLNIKKITLISFIIFILIATVTYLVWDVANITKSKKPKKGIHKDNGQNGKQKLETTQDIKNLQGQKLSQIIKNKQKELRNKLKETKYHLRGNLDWNQQIQHIIMKTYYQKCEDVIKEKKVIDNQLDVEDIANKYPEWQMVQESKSQIVLRRKLNKVCPKHKEQMYLGIKDGFVAIFYSDAQGKEKILKRKTNIAIEPLPKNEVANLKEGVEVNSPKELLTLLEGLASIQDERIE